MAKVYLRDGLMIVCENEKPIFSKEGVTSAVVTDDRVLLYIMNKSFYHFSFDGAQLRHNFPHDMCQDPYTVYRNKKGTVFVVRTYEGVYQYPNYTTPVWKLAGEIFDAHSKYVVRYYLNEWIRIIDLEAESATGVYIKYSLNDLKYNSSTDTFTVKNAHIRLTGSTYRWDKLSFGVDKGKNIVFGILNGEKMWTHTLSCAFITTREFDQTYAVFRMDGVVDFFNEEGQCVEKTLSEWANGGKVLFASDANPASSLRHRKVRE